MMKKIKPLKEEAAKRLEDIDQTWKSITETEGIDDKMFEIKQKNWDLFRNTFYNENDKLCDLDVFNKRFFLNNEDLLKKELKKYNFNNNPYNPLIHFF